MTDIPSIDDATAPENNEDDYDAMLTQLDHAVAEIVEKIDSGRIRDPETERVRIKYYRTLGYLIRTKRKVLEDQTLDELADEIEALKDEHGDHQLRL